VLAYALTTEHSTEHATALVQYLSMYLSLYLSLHLLPLLCDHRCQRCYCALYRPLPHSYSTYLCIYLSIYLSLHLLTLLCDHRCQRCYCALYRTLPHSYRICCPSSAQYYDLVQCSTIVLPADPPLRSPMPAPLLRSSIYLTILL
jgi:hypothetical protein